MKAWHIFDGEVGECSLLVFAETRNRARVLGLSGPWDYEDYISVSAIRAPLWDQYAESEAVIEINDDLPNGAPLFYDDSEYL